MTVRSGVNRSAPSPMRLRRPPAGSAQDIGAASLAPIARTIASKPNDAADTTGIRALVGMPATRRRAALPFFDAFP